MAPTPQFLADLACQVGYDPSRVSVVASGKEMGAIASSYGEAKDVESAQGLCIQVDDIPGGPDYRILIRYPLEPNTAVATRARLEQIACTEDEIGIVLQDEQSLLCFILLHEVAHHALKHKPTDDGYNEGRADFWAINRLKEIKKKWA